MASHLSLPVELTIQIYYNLDSLSDALALSSTSHGFRDVWLEHADSIYHELARRSIEGEKYARALQLSGNSRVSAKDASRICRRADFTSSMAEQFEQKVVKPMYAVGWREIYEKGRHPEHLTPTERRRFFRTYYQLWSFLRLPDAEWASAVIAFSMKEVYLMREMVLIPLPIGEDQPVPEVEEHFPDFVWYDEMGRRGRLGSLLQKRIEKHVRGTGRGIECPWIQFTDDVSMNGGYGGIMLLWDHHSFLLDEWCPRGS